MTKTKDTGPNCGDVLAAALAAAGASGKSEVSAGKDICETDWLVAGRAVFPDVPSDMVDEFNRRTMDLPPVVQSRARYELLAAFWHPKEFERRLEKAVRRFRQLGCMAKYRWGCWHACS